LDVEATPVTGVPCATCLPSADAAIGAGVSPEPGTPAGTVVIRAADLRVREAATVTAEARRRRRASWRCSAGRWRPRLRGYALAAYASDCEAHVREVEQFGHTLPDNSYGRHNRQSIAARETRIATRLRAVERAYRTTMEHNAPMTREPGTTATSADRSADHELELE
jgi:hypothetical protein